MLYHLREYQKEPMRLADRLVWAGLVDEGVVEQKEGLLQKTIEFRGADLESSTKEGLVAEMAKLNNALKRLGSGWTIFVEAQRRRARAYPESTFPDKVSGLIDWERRKMFKEGDTHYESRYYLTLVYGPPKETKSRFFGWLLNGGEGDEERGEPEEYLEHFKDKVASIVGLLRGVFPYVKPLDDDETLTYLHSTVSTNRHPVRAPETPVYLDAILPDEDVEAGLEVRLGEKFLRTVTIRSFPSTTVPGILDELNRLQFPYRWMTRFIAKDKQEAVSEIKRYQRRWYSQRKGLFSLISDIAGVGGSDLVNSDAIRKAEDADAALQEVQNDDVSYGLFTATVTVWGDTRKQAEDRIQEVEATIQSRGFTVIDEGLNALQAWLSSHPGNVYANVRRPLVSSLNLAHMLPVSAIWSGPEKNDHLDAPAHCVAQTKGGTPFRLATNVGDVGHTLVLGPTGAGKSTLLSLLALQWRRYDDAQVYFFDKGCSSRAATLAVGGDFYDLSLGDSDVAFQPLSDVDDLEERGWARDWLCDVFRHEGLEVTPRIKEALWNALAQLGERPKQQRTLWGLQTLVQHKGVRKVLEDYTRDGPYGALFDAEEERLGLSDWVALEMSTLMETPRVVPATLSYLFHRLESQFTGEPTLLVLDEAWMFLDNPQFAQKIREWLKVLRKKRVYVVFATQQVADATDSSIASAIIESCLTRIFLPNGRALEPNVAKHYKQLGLNRRQVELLAQAQPKRQYYYDSQRGSRLFELGLENCPAGLAVCGSSDPADQRMMDEILERSGRSKFAQRFFERKGLQWAAHAVRADDGDDEEYAATVAEPDPAPAGSVFSETIREE